MYNQYLDKIEYNKIINILSTYAITENGKEKCLNLFPQTEKKQIEKALLETTEAVSLLFRNGNPPFAELYNIKNHILNLKNGNFLSIKSLLEINTVLTVSRNLHDYYFETELNQSDSLTPYFEHLYTNSKIENQISSSILDENTLDDKASDTLYKIRQQIKRIQKDIKIKLQSILNSKFIQEPVVTIRQNRFVVPIKSEYKSSVKGLVHDSSGSGSTLFIEPFSVFELNNEISDLITQENIEIEKILQRLSSLFFDITDKLENNYNLIGLLDFIFAKAKYSKSTNCNCPKINENKIIFLKDAIHPLLDSKKAVPITLEIGNKYSTILITGPNTGGKTVTLKTVGLLTAMAQSGMHIPASQQSSIYIFDNIFADIGDNQNITESLSTFSSHMLNIINILKFATSNSLVLVDELGSGTDPVEGATLAISILEYLREKNVTTIATTHYTELKQYALLTNGIENASCEFNLDTLSPTYKLLIGVPGKSNAFEISKKLGLDESIINNARSLIGSDTAKIEDLLKEIYDSKSQIELEKEKIKIESSKISELKEKLEIEYNDFSEHKKEYIQKAKQEAKEIVLSAKQEVNDIIKEIELEKNNSKKINELRNKLNTKLSDYTNTNDTIHISKPISEKEIKNGMIVYVPSFGKNGTIISYSQQSNKANIQIENIKTTLPLSQITYAENSENTKSKKEIPQRKNSNFTPKKISTEINIIGMNIEESISLIDKFLDDASIAKLENVRIIHGKGSGALGKGIQNYLKTHPHVKTYRYGTFGEGEMGVTIVEIK